jgi:hypothetical protein
MTSHLFIPDTQVKPGVPTDHLGWAGRYILERRPDVVVHAGDHWDCESLSSYDRGKIQFEGRRYKADVKAGNDGFALLDDPIAQYNKKRIASARYNPRKVFLRGNHEFRVERTVADNAILNGTIGYDDFDTRDWEVHDFLKPVWIDGVAYCHFFANPMTGKPYGGQALTRLKTIGHSFVQGHQQVYESSVRFVAGKAQRAVIAGAYYLHDEDYKGYQGNAHWRGLLVFHEVEDGAFDIMEVSMNYLCLKYEGVTISQFLQEKYPDMDGTLWDWDHSE